MRVPPPGANPRSRTRVLHNRRLQVRFLSHLPLQTLDLSRLQSHGAQSILCALTLLDRNGGIVC